MKKLFLFAAVAALMASCDQAKVNTTDSDKAVDSLENIIEQKDNEINDLMGTFNEIQEGFNIINEAEGRVNMMKNNSESNNAHQNIRENMLFIQQTLQENKQKIAELQEKLNRSSINASKLKEAIANFEKLLEEKNQELESLRNLLAEKDIAIEHLDNEVNTLKAENEEVKIQKEETEKVVRNQDQQINTAWYVFGTSKELKQEGILNKGEVLQENYNKDYFTKIDIRKTTVIPLNSKHAELLTTHPSGSYTLLKDSKGEYTLRITDANKFWSVSKYLVIRVK